ncbi:hypothetical protein AVT46_gp46 [Mycobacterium phage MOOREtheMARYer]|uniref:Uncharacterized protein n=1 Tax=Mycobacterium phage MOOREtheMARYer TaxID=1647309 RepID=A0A0F6SJW1_9CAUD|nr:hypothetical protein AVT46_gp46 [Mycobacterium phage MOOREtheMARYer]AKF14907.1 hypothetical protein SEA_MOORETHEMARYER_46 [Mycobacterium phage MOOREtheMARYer]
MLTDTDRITRKIALASAIQNDPGASAAVIVEDAEAFRKFLAGEPAGQPTTEGNTQ